MSDERWLYRAYPWRPVGRLGKVWAWQCECVWGGDLGGAGRTERVDFQETSLGECCGGRGLVSGESVLCPYLCAPHSLTRVCPAVCNVGDKVNCCFCLSQCSNGSVLSAAWMPPSLQTAP